MGGGRKGSHDSVGSGRSNSLISNSWRKESVTIIEQTEPDETKEEDEEEEEEKANNKEEFPAGLPPLAPEVAAAAAAAAASPAKAEASAAAAAAVKDTLTVSAANFNSRRRSSAPGTADKFLSVPKQITASSSAETLTGLAEYLR